MVAHTNMYKELFIYLFCFLSGVLSVSVPVGGPIRRPPVKLKPSIPPDNAYNYVNETKSGEDIKRGLGIIRKIDKRFGHFNITDRRSHRADFKVISVSLFNSTNDTLAVYDTETDLDFVIGDEYNTTVGSANVSGVDFTTSFTYVDHVDYLTISLYTILSSGNVTLDTTTYELVEGDSKFNIQLESNYTGSEGLEYEIDILMKGSRDVPDKLTNKTFYIGDSLLVKWPERFHNGTDWVPCGTHKRINSTETLPWMHMNGTDPLVTIYLPVTNGTAWYDPFVISEVGSEDATTEDKTVQTVVIVVSVFIFMSVFAVVSWMMMNLNKSSNSYVMSNF